MIWEIEYYERYGKQGFLLSFMNKDKQMVKCTGGHFLPWQSIKSVLIFRRWEG